MITEKLKINWELENNNGRQVWVTPPMPRNTQAWSEAMQNMEQAFTYRSHNPNTADLTYRTLKEVAGEAPATGSPAYKAAYKAIDYYRHLQAEDGHLPGDYGGPLFLLPGLIIASHVTQSPLPDTHRLLTARYMLNHQNTDGGWGLHIEGPSTMFGTALQYVALRLLGHPANEPALQKAREWIRANGGATGIPSWGKFYLALLGVYEWDGCHSLFPEMWIFPEWLPFHPSRYWCHARMVYLPMAYCYGHRVTAERSPLIYELREELYTTPYHQINWQAARSQCTPADRYTQPSALLGVLNAFTNTYEKIAPGVLRKKTLKFILDYIHAEDEHTNYINIGPVNQVINSVCVWHALGKDSEPFKKHYQRWFDYLWIAEDGMKMNGYNGSQLWDTAFALQAVTEGGFEEPFAHFAQGMYAFVEQSQIQTEVREHQKYYRHPSVGGWPFSTAEHGWPITDCTAEGLKIMLADPEQRLGETRLKQAVDLLLSFQNPNGGWASYELTRGPKWLELINPSEIFGNIMVDYPYTECSSAALQALAKFAKRYPAYRPKAMQTAIEKGRQFIESQQRADGSWYGSWAVCFTYGTWFGVEGLLATGHAPYEGKKTTSAHIEKACQFLAGKQNPDGGWGESFESCLTKQYVPHKESQVVNTAWALLTLMAARYPNREVIDRGIKWLMSRQLPNGDFPQQGISGVFNHSCAITYTAYRNVFPIWALSRYTKVYGA